MEEKPFIVSEHVISFLKDLREVLKQMMFQIDDALPQSAIELPNNSKIIFAYQSTFTNIRLLNKLIDQYVAMMMEAGMKDGIS